jgi:hypothetical protein
MSGAIPIFVAETWTLLEVDQKYLENFQNVVLEKDGEYQLDQLCEK